MTTQDNHNIIDSNEKKLQELKKKNPSQVKKYLKKSFTKFQKLYYTLQNTLEVKKLKEEFLARKEVPTPKYRGQLHNYGKWISIIPSTLLIYSAQSKRSRNYAILYSIGVFWMQWISSKMHCRPYQSAPEWIRKLDNISIFLYIAMNWITLGSQLMNQDPQWEFIKSFLKIITCSAVLIRLITLHSPRWIISGMALAMGWISILGMKSMLAQLDTYEFQMFVAGGLSITIGAICWAFQFPKFKNSEWTPHETFHLGTVLMMGFFYLVLFSLQKTHPNGY